MAQSLPLFPVKSFPIRGSRLTARQRRALVKVIQDARAEDDGKATATVARRTRGAWAK
jgi:hypothetical protein